MSTCGCPTAPLLLEDVDVTIRQGETVLLRGPSGSGKTTLFRVLAGLWPFGRGRIGLPKDARVLFLPQKPYLPIGTLREVLSYPETPEHYTDEAYREVLEACTLGHLVPRLAESANWSLVLSGGEQQRLAFARALLYRPNWLFLDEASSALDEPTERRMYELLRRAPARRDRDQRRPQADGRGLAQAAARHRSRNPSRRRQRRSRVKRERVVVFSSEPEPHEWMFSAAVERHAASRCALHPQWACARAHRLG